jgi:hypothetical protein
LWNERITKHHKIEIQDEKVRPEVLMRSVPPTLELMQHATLFKLTLINSAKLIIQALS